MSCGLLILCWIFVNDIFNFFNKGGFLLYFFVEKVVS